MHARGVINKKLGENHDANVFEWMAQTVDVSLEVEFTLHTCIDEVAVQKTVDPCYVIQGDNIDKTVCACDVWMIKINLFITLIRLLSETGYPR